MTECATYTIVTKDGTLLVESISRGDDLNQETWEAVVDRMAEDFASNYFGTGAEAEELGRYSSSRRFAERYGSMRRRTGPYSKPPRRRWATTRATGRPARRCSRHV